MLCPWEQLEGKPFPIYIDIVYFMIWVPTMKKRSQKCSHGKLILGGKSQLWTPADCLPSPAGFSWMSGFLLLPFWHRLFFCLEASAKGMLCSTRDTLYCELQPAASASPLGFCWMFVRPWFNDVLQSAHLSITWYFLFYSGLLWYLINSLIQYQKLNYCRSFPRPSRIALILPP